MIKLDRSDIALALIAIACGGFALLVITLAAFVIVTPALIQTIVDSRPIDKKHDRPHHKQQKRGAAKRPQNQDQLSLPGWCRLFLVPTEH